MHREEVMFPGVGGERSIDKNRGRRRDSSNI